MSYVSFKFRNTKFYIRYTEKRVNKIIALLKFLKDRGKWVKQGTLRRELGASPVFLLELYLNGWIKFMPKLIKFEVNDKVFMPQIRFFKYSDRGLNKFITQLKQYEQYKKQWQELENTSYLNTINNDIAKKLKSQVGDDSEA